MSIFRVMYRPDVLEPGSDLRHLKLIEDKFSWTAAIVPPAYALAHGLWFELVLYIVALLVVWFIGSGLGADAGVWTYILLCIWIGFEATSFRLSALRRKGYRADGDIVAEDEMLAAKAWVMRGVAA